MPTDPRPDWVLASRQAIGHRIATLRTARGMSVDDLAEAAGVDRKSVMRAEGASVSTGLDLLLMLADGLGVSVAHMVDVEVPRPPT
ncbi:helix-turn-helix domain-containing protein [Streptomyces cocklensis]|uniref:helix-turn-helix domain-containing protein n=1 Tax=Actinacidiphila cocklensis TaxID=887465 RepID=UPI00203DB4BF|nr:helix-turn-helix domain-containing protein [Actinacidiphila cocklensis]MDD1057932.1 helix-turn-helix domain-containing protein [Actinacidiphila cocklensis]